MIQSLSCCAPQTSTSAFSWTACWYVRCHKFRAHTTAASVCSDYHEMSAHCRSVSALIPQGVDELNYRFDAVSLGAPWTRMLVGLRSASSSVHAVEILILCS